MVDVAAVLNEINIGRCSTSSSLGHILASTKESTFAWCEEEKCIYTFPADPAEIIFQKLALSITPVFEVSSISISPAGQYALLSGGHGLAVVELPRIWGSRGFFENEKLVIHCSVVLLDESHFQQTTSTKVLQADWYTGSPHDAHVIVLTNQNSLRFYDTNQPNSPLQRLPLQDSLAGSRSMNAMNNFAAVTGDIAVAFDSGSPVLDKRGASVYPIYVVLENGNVLVVYCRLVQNRIDLDKVGPIPMSPPSDNNYGCDYKSIVCLATSPSIVVMATSSGCVYHCAVIESEPEELSRSNKFAGGMPDVELFVYESVQLELTLLDTSESETSPAEESEKTKHDKLHLIKDATFANSYVCVSDGGIHAVTLPWLDDLQALLQPVIDLDNSCEQDDISTPADANYVLCTRPTMNGPASPPCGCLLTQSKGEETQTLTCILSSGEIISIDLKPRAQPQASYASGPNASYSSPLRKLRGVDGFDKMIKQMLTRSATIPVIRCGGGDKLISPDEYFQLLTKTTQILREEYIQKMTKAKIELERRCCILRNKHSEQQQELAQLSDHSALSVEVENLGGKLENAQGQMYTQFERVQRLLQKVHSSSPIMSAEETAWSSELKTLQDKIVKLRRQSEMVNTKHENQLLRTNLAAGAPTESVLSTKQAINIRSILKDQGKQIEGLVKDVQSMGLSS